MCGILGIATVANRSVRVGNPQVLSMRDRLSHRGPDGSGLWRSASGQFVFAHRRLAVIDPTPAGAQPMLLGEPDPTHAITYNGELYNDAEIRHELTSRGVRFRSSSDTETVLHALATWGIAALTTLRGMFALGFVDIARRRLVLARDPLGIKPLYYWVGPADTDPGAIEIVFASEPAAILAHPSVECRPDLVTLSSYLTTIRTTLGDRTLYQGIRVVRPGEILEFDLSDGPSAGQVTRSFIPPEDRLTLDDATIESAAVLTGNSVRDSVHRHLRSDVPTCVLLSGGLDSSVIASIAKDFAGAHLLTFCSGFDDGDQSSDLAVAARTAQYLGTRHTSASVTRDLFAQRWPEMVSRLRSPLSTPNEVAINEVARRLRSAGCIVTLSGEGADEFFGGYELPMWQAWEWSRRAERESGGLFQLKSNAWIGPHLKPIVLRPEVWTAAEHDTALAAFYEDEFAAVEAQPPIASERHDEAADRVQHHLRFYQRINLLGLLQRLDTATMLEGVEGRTPLADLRIAALANSLPLSCKYEPNRGTAGTKIALRRAFADALPAEVVSRPKASFPLPFQQWMVDHVDRLRTSTFARAIFNDEAVESVCADPGRLWNMTWPMINIAMWGEQCWGSGSASR